MTALVITALHLAMHPAAHSIIVIIVCMAEIWCEEAKFAQLDSKRAHASQQLHPSTMLLRVVLR
jgi:hypothetical protein